MLKIVKNAETHCKKFNCKQHVFDIEFNRSDLTFGQAHAEINKFFSDLHIEFESLMNENDYARITFLHKDFEHPIGYPFMSKSTLSETNLQNTFDHITQSYRNVILNQNNSFKAVIVVAHLPTGGSSDYISQQDYLNKSINYINIKNEDNLCGLRAVIIAVAYDKYQENKTKENLRTFNKLSRFRSTMLQTLVDLIGSKCNIFGKCSILQFRKLEVYFRRYQIIVIENNGKTNPVPIYDGNYNERQIYLCYTGSHYNVIKRPKVFFKATYICIRCNKKYKNLKDHFCQHICQLCKRPKCNFVNKIDCCYCGKSCKSEICLELHKTNNCRVIKKCNKCDQIKLNKNHVCIGEKYCKNCKCVVDINHTCYILTEQQKKNQRRSHPKNYQGLIWFDYESYQINDKHEPNLIVAESMCVNCLKSLKCERENCGTIKIFYNNFDFCQWLFSSCHKYYISIAHNASGNSYLYYIL